MYSPAVRCLWLVVGSTLAAAVASADPQSSEERDAAARLSAEQSCAAHESGCNWMATFSTLERASLARGLAKRGLELDPAPWGKIVGKIYIYNEDVFAEDNWLRFFNHFHYTTRERAIRDELTVSEGQPWDDDLIAESARRLHDPLYSSVVALVPVKSAEPGKVDVFVVTRDVFSIRLNTQYTFQQGSLTNLSISLSENNFLGTRDLAAAAVLMDQGKIAVGPLFIDKNLFGKHIDFRVRADEIITRQNLPVLLPQPPPASPMQFPTTDPKGIEDGGGFKDEGRDATISLSRPLWSLASTWGGGASFSYSDSIQRQFYGTGLLGYADANTPTPLPWEYRLKSYNFNANVVRQWGTLLKQQLSIGYGLTTTNPYLRANFPDDPVQQQDFIAHVFPRTEVISAPFVEYSFFDPTYKTVRNMSSYELAEDLRLGPDLDVSVQQGLTVIGSDYTFTRPAVALGWTFPWCHDGYFRPSVGGSVRFQEGTKVATSGKETIDNTSIAQIRFATPSLGAFRIVGQTYIESRWHDTQNTFYYLGGDPALRGYDYLIFKGERLVSGQLEVRTIPVPWWVLRVGGVMFYDVGGAANTLGQLALYHDVGIGLRILIPQTSRDLFRFDLAFPLQEAPDGASRFIPHPVLSYQSAF